MLHGSNYVGTGCTKRKMKIIVMIMKCMNGLISYNIYGVTYMMYKKINKKQHNRIYNAITRMRGILFWFLSIWTRSVILYFLRSCNYYFHDHKSNCGIVLSFSIYFVTLLAHAQKNADTHTHEKYPPPTEYISTYYIYIYITMCTAFTFGAYTL